ncbi:methyltransferase domain-containing protein [Lyngbya aestuarii]|uniref:methyltransferase domain-containing protein n=1 Tax=Lyngbya aestuarii TaxID=118322 RepID=UPI00403DBA27
MSNVHFDSYLHCPICGVIADEKPFYINLYDSPDVLNFINNYYDSRVDNTIFPGADFRINKCRKCDFYWHQNVLNQANLSRLYNEWISPEKSYAKQAKKSVRERMGLTQVVARQLDAVQANTGQPKVLDFGGGWGTSALCALALGCEAYLIESSQEKINFAQEKGLKLAQHIEDFPDDFFDLIILNQVLEHVPEPKQLLTKLVRILRLGGGCSISVPHARPNSPVLAKGPFQPLEHINGFTRKSLRKIVLECKLKLCKEYSTHSELNFLSLSKSLAKNSLLAMTSAEKLPLNTSIFALRRS